MNAIHRTPRSAARLAALSATAAVRASLVSTAPPASAAPRPTCPHGTVERQAQPGGDHTCVAPATLGRRMTGFVPALHGFAFDNSFQTSPLFDIRFGGLCGGMSYAALDHFFTHRPIPRQNTRPATGTPLFQYINSRQEDSVRPNLDKWTELTLNPFGWRNKEFFRWGLQGFGGGRLQELREAIDAGRPVPLGLFKQNTGLLGPHHQVVAVGYRLGRYTGDLGAFQSDLRIYVYDPNHPDKIMTLAPRTDQNLFGYLEAPDETWRTYFVDRKYSRRTPPSIPAAPAPRPGTVSELLVTIGTGGDDLRGGNDNADLTVTFKHQPVLRVSNINHGARWIDRYAQTVRVPLPHPIDATELSSLTLSTAFGGGTGGDNWNVDSLNVTTSDGKELSRNTGNPLVRFTGQTHTFTVPLH
ncbi:hypothetical protein ACIRJO_37800 [Streptomyces sp. NPDC102394]|uniref:hypothetical protein n=1 Tax=Streptomyces sp. NPDC102394 TaxID=3366167 RepID=UPI0037FA0533